MMLLALGALICVGVYHATKGKGRRRKRAVQNANKTLETGTKNGPVDYSWIPESTLKALSMLFFLLSFSILIKKIIANVFAIILQTFRSNPSCTLMMI